MTENALQKLDFEKELQSLNGTVEVLMKQKHFAKIGPENLFLLVQHAKVLGMNPLHAVNGGLYAFNGLVGMYSREMNIRIRQAGHSITKSNNSTNTVCILKGKRVDTGDEMIVSFSIDDAKRAGIYKNNWEKYPEDMCFARCVSKLARQLFPDVVHGLYTVEELRDMETADDNAIEVEEMITEEQATNLKMKLEGTGELQSRLLQWCQVTSVDNLTVFQYEKVLKEVERYWEMQKQVKKDKENQGATGQQRVARNKEEKDIGDGRSGDPEQLSLLDASAAVGAKKGA